MALFDALIGDIAGRFGLGPNAGPLVREVLNLAVGSPQGLGGFLAKLNSAGLASEIASWLGNTNAAPLATQQVESALGSTVLSGIASRIGINASVVSTAVGYVLPKLIGVLTPGGKIPASLPSEVASFLSSGFAQRVAAPVTRAAGQVAPQQIQLLHDEPRLSRWLWPLLGGLALLGLGSYLFSANRPAPVVRSVMQAPVVPDVTPAPTLPARLALSNEDGVVDYSGSVHDEETRASIVNALQTVFGADKVRGDIGVDLNRGAAPWLVNLRTALESLKIPGVQALFEGNSVNVGGIIGDAELTRISNSLKGALGSRLVYGSLTDKVTEIVTGANSKVAAALTSLRSGFSARDLIGVLNQSIINFPTAESEVPADAAALLQNAATQFKQLGPGTVLEIAGYTDNVGDATANLALSQRRADSVRNFLVRVGVNPSVLVAKGYGSANPVASNDLLEGRFRNRRIEYHLLKSSSQANSGGAGR